MNIKAEIVNIKKEKSGTVELNGKIFDVKWNPNLVHQALITQTGNRRDPWANARTRGEVSGGGKKPWKQKGTGRARHGSSRSPIWKGGGVTHGPLAERSFERRINKKMNRGAIFSVLSRKFKDGDIIIVDNFDGVKNKTKDWSVVLKNLVDLRSKTLVILEAAKKDFVKAISSIAKVDTLGANALNVSDLLTAKRLVIESGAIKEIEKIYKI